MTVAAALVAVGEVLKPYGLSGEVRVRSLSDRTEERFRHLDTCYLWDPGTDWQEPCRIASCRFESEDTVLIRLAGIDSPEAARRLAGRLLAVERERALPAPEGSFYPWQLEGARVERPDGEVIGSFAGIEHGAQDLWVVERDGRECLVPAVPEIVLEVNVRERRIVIDPPEGLLEL